MAFQNLFFRRNSFSFFLESRCMILHLEGFYAVAGKIKIFRTLRTCRMYFVKMKKTVISFDLGTKENTTVPSTRYDGYYFYGDVKKTESGS